MQNTDELRFRPIRIKFWKRFVRRMRAMIEDISPAADTLVICFAFAGLLTSLGCLIKFTFEPSGWSLDSRTIISLSTFLLSLLPLIYMGGRWLDDQTRDHVGGLTTEAESCAIVHDEIIHHQIASSDSHAFQQCLQFADDIYAGTMSAGRGRTRQSRLDMRANNWRPKVETNPDSLAIAVDKNNNEIAAITMAYPIESATYKKYLEDKVCYTAFTPPVMKEDPEKAKTALHIYIAVTAGHPYLVNNMESVYRYDLVGTLLASHLRTIIERYEARQATITLFTDGFRGKCLKSFERKGFVGYESYKDCNGYPILLLGKCSNERASGFFKAIFNASPLVT